MHSTARLNLLKEVYRIYDGFITEVDVACEKNCATCCTRNITATSLEGQLILNYWDNAPQKKLMGRIEAASHEPRFEPRTTINRIADQCAKGLDIPEESAVPGTKACPLLVDDACRVYPVRPFGCRAMVSRTKCALTGEADMPELVLTVNNVLLQYIEALDPNGVQGNLIDVLLSLNTPRSSRVDLPNNHPLTVLMAPPEHRDRIRPILNALTQAQRNLT